MRRRIGMALGAALVATFALAKAVDRGAGAGGWTAEERQRIASLSLSSLPTLPSEPSNAVADLPAAAALGEALFADTRLSANGKVACATCHDPARQFQDGLPAGRGVGVGTRRTMPIAGTAYSPWMFWDGRADSQWAQALGPLENPLEHGSDRRSVVKVVIEHYATEYRAIFGVSPDAQPIDRAFANVGKAIAAFERTIMPERTRFDAYADSAGRAETNDILTDQEVAGLRLFIDKGKCLDCHNGPLLTDNDFHNIGLPSQPDPGRIEATAKVKADPFNCVGVFSDATADQCMELAAMKVDGSELIGSFKTPSLRGVTRRAPFMHNGALGTIGEVLAHYNAAPAATIGHSELTGIALTTDELAALASFLDTLAP